MNVEWIKCIMQSRCRLDLINLDNTHFDSLTGVYLIWQGKDKRNVIKIGSGAIRECLTNMKKNTEVQKFAPDLFVTWASVPLKSLNGVEAFLNNEFHPRLSGSLNAPDLININLP
ncbi:MAG: hypothetical protein EHM47_02400 [Ignavibacteriales bacterium]|nr:MAG: hypothetical protein EHM47_02400 [Ignavibacteriales bacterium]